MKPAVTLALMFAAGIALLVGLILLRPSPSAPRPDTADPYEPPVELVIPEFGLVDARGAPVTHHALEGRYTVLDFFFTSCPLYCPGMTAQMRRVQGEVESDRLRLMSISIDGGNDTPEVIGAYAAGFGADPERWTFATGPRERVWSIVRELGFLVEEEPGSSVTTPGGETMAMINHPTRLMLVGPDRRIIGLYRYTERDEIDALIDRLNALLG
ncbi:MAG: SCO family protein [Phycisphaerales bacterium JB040]